MHSTYRALLARPGARRLAAICGIAWLSYSIYGVGFVLLVEHHTGSFAAAGGVIAAFSVGSALLAPLRGRLVDRDGPRRLLPLGAVHTAALIGLAVAADLEAPLAVLIALGGLGGASVPPLIATARTSWPVVAGERLAPTGHALNAALGEAAQVIGPLMLGAAVLVVDPAVPVIGLLGGILLACVLLAQAPRPLAQLEPWATRPHAWTPPTGAGYRLVLGVEGLLAVAFGALDVALPARASDLTGSTAGGVWALGVLAAASAAAALWSGASGAAHSARGRFLGGILLAAAALAATPWLTSLHALAVASIPAGIGTGLAFAAVLELLDDLVDASRSIEAFTWLTTAGGAGTAAGAALAGALAGPGMAATMLVAPLAVGAAAALALTGRRTLHARPPQAAAHHERAAAGAQV